MCIYTNIAWFTDDGVIRPVTFWVVGDFDQPAGRQLLYDAIRHTVKSDCTEVKKDQLDDWLN